MWSDTSACSVVTGHKQKVFSDHVKELDTKIQEAGDVVDAGKPASKDALADNLSWATMGAVPPETFSRAMPMLLAVCVELIGIVSFHKLMSPVQNEQSPPNPLPDIAERLLRAQIETELREESEAAAEAAEAERKRDKQREYRQRAKARKEAEARVAKPEQRKRKRKPPSLQPPALRVVKYLMPRRLLGGAFLPRFLSPRAAGVFFTHGLRAKPRRSRSRRGRICSTSLANLLEAQRHTDIGQ
jgi:hypothetical protein